MPSCDMEYFSRTVSRVYEEIKKKFDFHSLSAKERYRMDLKGDSDVTRENVHSKDRGAPLVGSC